MYHLSDQARGIYFLCGEAASITSERQNDDMDFCQKLAREESVVVLPGMAVGLKNWVRINFAIEPSSLKDGLRRIKAFCKDTTPRGNMMSVESDPKFIYFVTTAKYVTFFKKFTWILLVKINNYVHQYMCYKCC